MDPICHTLVGASLAATGLREKTRFGTATLVIAANLPDIDVAAHFIGDLASYEWRRGITHGLPALVVLPVLLALLLHAYGRLRPRAAGPPLSLRWLVILSVIGVVSHPSLDWLNNYGMRWLMPFVDRWFYGDTLFIIDLVMWGALLVGLVLTRFVDWRRLAWHQRPATLALAFAVAYIGMNYVITQRAEALLAARYTNAAPPRFMASPVQLTPFRREFVLDYPGEYRFARFDLFGQPAVEDEELVIPKGPLALADRVTRPRDAQVFLHWARFPYAVLSADRTEVTLADARYVRDIDNPRLDGFGLVRLRLDDTSDGTAGSVAGRPGPLEVEAAEVPGDVDDLADEKKPGLAARFERLR